MEKDERIVVKRLLMAFDDVLVNCDWDKWKNMRTLVAESRKKLGIPQLTRKRKQKPAKKKYGKEFANLGV